MHFAVDRAQPFDAADIAAIRTAAAERLTLDFGVGPWSAPVTVDVVRRDLRTPLVLVARASGSPVATVRLQTRKPWAIDVAHFSPVARALYVVNMAVDPEVQRQGIGRRLLDEIASRARAWPAQALRLDAYEGPAGAGPFYERCGYREVWRGRWRGTPLRYLELVLTSR